MRGIRRLVAAFLVSGVALSVGPISGWGAHPVSKTLSALWLLKSGFTTQKVLPVIVYFRGAPGWVDEKTTIDAKFGVDPSHVKLLVSKWPVELTYTDADGFVQLYGTKAFTGLTNVFLVSNVTSDAPVVEKLGYFKLTFGPEENPATVLLAREPSLRSKLGVE